MTAFPQDVVAELKTRIAELELRLQASNTENARLEHAVALARDRQQASAEILRTIARTPVDAMQSLQQIAETCGRLFGAPSVSIRLAENGEWTQDVGYGETSKRVRSAVPTATIRIGGPNLPGTVVAENRQVHISDLDHIDRAMADWPGLPHARAAGTRTMCGTPLRREDKAIGVLIVYRDELLPFTPDDLALQQSFADQAVIAIENARLFGEVQAKTRNLEESLQQQTATADVLKVISRSAFDLQSVLDTLVASAAELCGADGGVIWLRKGNVFHAGAAAGFSPQEMTFFRDNPRSIHDKSLAPRVLRSRRTEHIPDRSLDPEFAFPGMSGLPSTMLGVPLLRDDHVEGVFTLARKNVAPFTPRQIELVESFADQAVIAIGNVRLFDEVQAKTRDLTEALTYQTGSANILKVIASSPTDVGPVLQAIVDSACELCEAHDALVHLREGDHLRYRAHHGPIPFGFEKLPSSDERIPFGSERLPINRNWVTGRSVVDKVPVHLHDVLSAEGAEFPEAQRLSRREGTRTVLSVPLLRDNESIGAIVLRRTEVNPFSEKQIALLQTFADQAVIAIGNVRLFEEVQAKTRDLTEALTYQTGSANILKVIASSPTDVEPALKAIVESACELCGAYDAAVVLRDGDDLRFSAHHGPIPIGLEKWPINRNWTAGRAFIDQIPVHIEDLRDERHADFPDGRELAIRMGHRTILSVPLLREKESIGAVVLRRKEVHPFTDKQIALLQTFADQAVIAIGNVRLFEEVQARTKELARSLDDLHAAQDRLVQTEKLASLGQLTAGIAHEIKNPLNFVNNFAALSGELVDELNELLKTTEVAAAIRDEVDELTGMLQYNLQKVVQHGKRADSIVKNMLLHSREGSGEHRPTDVNALVEESLNLAYHGARAEKPQFDVTLKREFDPAAGMLEAFPQEITRVLLNLIANGFHAIAKRKAGNGADEYEPALVARTRDAGAQVEIRIRDNGTGIPPEVRDKMFNPFFTTKPAGEGTGLGLSMSHDIIVKQHGGTIEVETVPGEFTEFTIRLPRRSTFSGQTRG